MGIDFDGNRFTNPQFCESKITKPTSLVDVNQSLISTGSTSHE